MKTITALGLVIGASCTLIQSATADSRGNANSFATPVHPSRSASHFAGQAPGFSGGAPRFSGGAQRFSNGAPRFYDGAPRFSSEAPRFHGSSPRFSASTMPSYSAARVAARANLRRATVTDASVRSERLMQRVNGSGFSENRRARTLANENLRPSHGRGFNKQNHIIARRDKSWHPEWDRHCDHFWHGHRCRWQNGCWVIFYPGFYPYDFYPSYSYYDPGYYPIYDASYDTSYDSGYDSNSDSSYDPDTDYAYRDDYSGSDSIVSEIQAKLAGEGYYRGPIDGVLGPRTRSAVARYQADHGLRVTGRVDAPTLEALRLRYGSYRG